MSATDEKESLLKGKGEATAGSYGIDSNGGDSPTTGNHDAGEPENGASAGTRRKHPSGKRERLKRNPSLDKVDEMSEKEKEAAAENAKKFGCSDYFGVKSYLHDFYDTHFYKDPHLYEEEDDYRYLLHSNPRRRKCTSIWWKVFVWIGANFLVFGIIGVLVGYLVPQRPIIVGSIADNIEIVDKEAISFNFNLDVFKLVGLILFCIGGLTLTVALLFPSFLYQYCDDERRESAFKVRVGDEQPPPKSPVEMTIPSSSKVSGVQPDRKQDESIVTQEGMVSIKD